MKRNVNEIHLKIDNLIPFVNEKYVGFRIEWSADIGFGEYTIYKPVNSDKWFGDSECMDRDDDKDFIKELTRLFIEKLNVSG